MVGADKKSFYYISASQINNNLTLRIDLLLTNNIVNLRFDCTSVQHYNSSIEYSLKETFYEKSSIV